MKFPVNSLLAGNFYFQRRVRSRLTPPAVSHAKPKHQRRTVRSVGSGSSAFPGGDHREVEIHKDVDKKGNAVIEKDIHREGVSGSGETHTKTETDRGGGTTTTRETTTKPR